MKLTLDHKQRLNLHAMLGAQRADVGSIRAIWAIQDRIALDTEEENALELKRQIVGGQERLAWNPALSLRTREFELSDPDIARIKAVVRTWDSYNAGTDRAWLEPLLDMLFSPGDSQ